MSICEKNTRPTIDFPRFDRVLRNHFFVPKHQGSRLNPLHRPSPMTAEHPSDKPVCFRCRSGYKVQEVEPNKFCCSGFCLRYYQGAKEKQKGLDTSSSGSIKSVVQVVAEEEKPKEEEKKEEAMPPNQNGKQSFINGLFGLVKSLKYQSCHCRGYKRFSLRRNSCFSS